MIDKLCINHPVETITKIYRFHDNMDLFPFFMQIGNERMESKKGLILSLGTTAQCKTMGKSKYFSILQYNQQKQIYLNISYI